MLLIALIYYWKILFPPKGKIVQGCDLVQTYYQKFMYRDCQFAKTNPYIYNGYPFMAHPYNGVFYPFNLLFKWLPINEAYSVSYAIHSALAGWFMLLLTGSYVSAVAFAFSGFIACRIWAGHHEVVITSAWIPLIFWLYSTGHPVLGGIVMAIQFFAGHTQTSLYTLIIVLSYTVWAGCWYPLLWFIMAFGISVSPQLIPSLQFARRSTRANGLPFKYCMYGSLNPRGILRFVFPSIFGNYLKTKDYGSPTRGEVYWEHCYYVGIVPLVLAIMAPPGFFKYLVVIGILLALGVYNPVYWFLCRLPVFNAFKWPGRALIITNFALCALAKSNNVWLILITFLDLYWFSRQFLYLRNEQDLYPPKEVMDYLNKYPGKILTLPVRRPGVDWEPGILDFAPNATIPLKIVNITGYDPFILKDYHDLTNKLQGLSGYGQCTIKIKDPAVLIKHFNVKYVYSDTQVEGTELLIKTKLGGLYVVKDFIADRA